MLDDVELANFGLVDRNDAHVEGLAVAKHAESDGPFGLPPDESLDLESAPDERPLRERAAS